MAYDNIGKGRAAAITDADIIRLALDLDMHPAHIEGVAEAESTGFGWWPDGHMKILPEKHQFYKHVAPSKRDEAVRRGLAKRKWVSPANGGYKEFGGSWDKQVESRYGWLTEAMKLDRDGALKSISMGKFQIMGFNYEICGFVSPWHMWNLFLDSEFTQLEAFVNYLHENNLVAKLRNGDWYGVAKGYNGTGQAKTYARIISDAVAALKRGKWRNWDPDKARKGIKAKPAPKEPPKAKREPIPPKPPKAPREPAPKGVWGFIADLIRSIIRSFRRA